MNERNRRMRVALVVGQFPAISETFILKHATGLLDRGIDVSILAVTRLPQTATHGDVEAYGLLQRTRYGAPAPAASWPRRLAIARLLARGAATAARQGGSVRRLLDHGREDANFALQFADLAGGEPERFDVIHCHFGPFGRLGLALRNLGLVHGRLVTTFHGYDMSRTLVEAGPDVYARLFREGDLFLPVSEHWRRRLLELGCPPERTVVQRMGVDVEAFAFTPARPRADGEPVRLLSVARLTEKKGVEYAVRAVAQLHAEGRPVRYVIVGDGPLRAELEQLIASLGVGDAVELRGAVDGATVATLMAEAHALVAPSVTAADGNQEGLPVVLMEAMASGLPVVSTRHTGIPELVQHDVTGLLVAERDVEGLTAQLRRLLDEPGLGRRLAEAARERVREEHDAERLTDRLVSLYQDLVGPRRTAEAAA